MVGALRIWLSVSDGLERKRPRSVRAECAHRTMRWGEWALLHTESAWKVSTSTRGACFVHRTGIVEMGYRVDRSRSGARGGGVSGRLRGAFAVRTVFSDRRLFLALAAYYTDTYCITGLVAASAITATACSYLVVTHVVPLQSLCTPFLRHEDMWA